MYDSCIAELGHLQGIQITGCLFLQKEKVRKVQIRGFSDASQEAYAAVVYLRVEYESDETELSFLLRNQKYAPLNHIVYLDWNYKGHYYCRY